MAVRVPGTRNSTIAFESDVLEAASTTTPCTYAADCWATICVQSTQSEMKKMREQIRIISSPRFANDVELNAFVFFIRSHLDRLRLSFVRANEVGVLPRVGRRPFPREEFVGTRRDRLEDKIPDRIARCIPIKIRSPSQIRSIGHQCDGGIGEWPQGSVQNGTVDGASVASDNNLDRTLSRFRYVQSGSQDVFNAQRDGLHIHAGRNIRDVHTKVTRSDEHCEVAARHDLTIARH